MTDPKTRQRQIIALFKEGKSYGEIAKATGASRGMVSGVISRARADGSDLPKRPGGRSKKESTRAKDERDLSILRLRGAGLTVPEIVRRLGVSENIVRNRSNDIRNADLAESGEPEAVVAAGYWA